MTTHHSRNLILMVPAMPLRTYAGWLQQVAPEEAPKYEHLERLAQEGKLAGAYKQGREWWINLLRHGQLGEEIDTHATQETEAAPKEGRGLTEEKRQRLVPRDQKQGRGELGTPRIVRHRR